MTTVKVKFRASSVPMREGTLFYQVIHDRVPRQINTGYKLFPSNGIGCTPKFSCLRMPGRAGILIW